MSGGVILLVVVMVMVLTVLFIGLGAMIKGGKFNEKYGNKLMVLRVVLQALAVVLLLILLAVSP